MSQKKILPGKKRLITENLTLQNTSRLSTLCVTLVEKGINLESIVSSAVELQRNILIVTYVTYT